MRYARHLPEGGRIGFVAPSFGCNIEPYKTAFGNALKKFQELGYMVKCGPNAFEGRGLGISNSPEKCAKEFAEWYCSAETDVLLSCGGGELMCEILDKVDFQAIKEADAKWFMGYSDNTNLTFLLAVLCDTAAIYGPCAPAFGMEPWHQSLADAMKLLKGESHQVRGYPLWEKESLKTEEDPLVPYHVTEKRVLKAYLPGKAPSLSKRKLPEKDLSPSKRKLPEKDLSPSKRKLPEKDLSPSKRKLAEKDLSPSKMDLPEEERVSSGENRIYTGQEIREIRMKGRLLGGCLDSLINLCGTSFDKVKEFNERYGEEGVIWFFEACDLTVFSIRRALWQLAHAGWFEKTRGFLIGRPYCFGQEMMGLDQYRAVTDMLCGYQVPIIMDLDLGHLPPMMPLVCGSMADVRVEGNEIRIDMKSE